ncbi:MAG: hypothetical protein EPO26_02955 [Chloroflexota bacterium]|nr:MAG: hypothetical protein EPO26_02955 [Chloroflexota bacterium]
MSSGWINRWLLAGVLASLLTACLVAGTTANESEDYALETGWFFRQAAGESNGRGFAITNENSIRFWSEFNRLGGVEYLGYPISRRFYLDGFISQATQRGILQWRPELGEAQLLNAMEFLTRIGADDSLAKHKFVPYPAGAADESTRASWLATSGPIRDAFNAIDHAPTLFGLPLSPIAEIGGARAMRFQRGVIYVWNDRHPWVNEDGVSFANAGEFIKEARGIPDAALVAENPPAARNRRDASRAGRRDDTRISGVATWYGQYFHGRSMANGEPYDMWDPSTAASNTHRLGTYLRVTRVATGKSIVVRVTDRGAFRMPIVVDLSYAAFSSLADPSDGVIRIVVEPID